MMTRLMGRQEKALAEESPMMKKMMDLAETEESQMMEKMMDL